MPQEWDLNRRVVIRKLPENATKDEIKDLFGKYGEINNIFIARNPPGFAFIEYVRRRDAERAVRVGNGKRCCGVYVSAELTISNLDRTVVVWNLKRCATKEGIKKVFKNYGKVVRTWLDKHCGQIIAFVEYVSSSEATAAVKALNGKRCCDCIIRVALPSDPNFKSKQSKYQLRRTREVTIESSLSESSCESNNSRKVSSSNMSTKRAARAGRELTAARNTRQRLDCSICMHNTLKRRPTSTSCGHIFCKICIETAIQRNGKCPQCRKELNVENLIQMFPSV